jgi:5'-3' exonuclease
MIYPEYKDRGIDPNAPPELDDFGMTDYQYYCHQVSWIQKILECFGIPQLKVDGKEGDDTLYQATRLLRGHKVIVSEDRDFFTLIREDLSCFRPVRKEYVELGNFREVTGHKSPRHYLYAKSIIGDGSDNIPAIAKGVGEKTVLDVLNLIDDPAEVTSSRILREASTFKKARYDKLVLAGESAINKNLDLIDISREAFTIFELQSLVDILEKKIYPNVEISAKIFRTLEFNPETVDYITKNLLNMSTYPLSQLLNKDYLKSVMMGNTSILE